MNCPVVGRLPVCASTMVAEMAIFPGVACRVTQNMMTAIAGSTHCRSSAVAPAGVHLGPHVGPVRIAAVGVQDRQQNDHGEHRIDDERPEAQPEADVFEFGHIHANILEVGPGEPNISPCARRIALDRARPRVPVAWQRGWVRPFQILRGKSIVYAILDDAARRARAYLDGTQCARGGARPARRGGAAAA
jgi:hypothetical protein